MTLLVFTLLVFLVMAVLALGAIAWGLWRLGSAVIPLCHDLRRPATVGIQGDEVPAAGWAPPDWWSGFSPGASEVRLAEGDMLGRRPAEDT